SQFAVMSSLGSIDLAPFAPGTEACPHDAQAEIVCVQGATRVSAASCERTPTASAPDRLSHAAERAGPEHWIGTDIVEEDPDNAEAAQTRSTRGSASPALTCVSTPQKTSAHQGWMP